ncbi:MAG TPA: hypothetical protein DCE14_01465 [Kosmotogaceae bacterium]|nr:MAG: hypothetical protein XE05_0826 [Thermotogales bacterium 46_20]HAA85005.1 hypothetical protein [Kosmotogaceae bacterium]
MKISIMPRTKNGRMSVRLIVLFAVFLTAFNILAHFDVGGSACPQADRFFDYSVLAGTLILAGASGILSLVFGTISVLKNRERSILVFLSAGLGAFILWFALGEILIPH